MSAAANLNSEKIKRLLHFLEKGSLKESCKKFKINDSAFRECIVETTKSLLNFYIKSDEQFLGNVSHSRDIYTNKLLIMKCYNRLRGDEKPNSLLYKDENTNTLNDTLFYFVYYDNVAREHRVNMDGRIYKLSRIK